MQPSGLGQIRPAHQVTVALACRAPAFGDCPDDQALPAAAVPGSEYAFQAGCVPVVLGADIAARVAVDAEITKQRLLRPEEAHGDQCELRRTRALGAGDLDRGQAA